MNAIKDRRSIRKYLDKKVPNEMVEEILRAGMSAPSARNMQPWHFIVVDDKKVLEGISKVLPHAQMLKEAPCAIIVCGDINQEVSKDFWVQDCSNASQNILIAATELGLGSVWVGVYPREERVKGIQKFFKLPENIMPLNMLVLGYAAEEKGYEERFNPLKVHLNKW